jgi:uncharacterized LabA/DUF88 family protein
MPLSSTNKIAVFIDGHHLYQTSRSLGFDVDYKAFLEYTCTKGQLLRAYYYCAMLDSDEYSPLKPLTDWLAYNGYAVVKKTAKEYTDGEGRRRIKGDVEIEMVVDMLEQAPNVDHILLVSGDVNLVRAVQSVQQKGVRVTALSSRGKTGPSMIADELRRQVDEFLEVSEVSNAFTRRLRDATVREPIVREPIVREPIATPADPFATVVEAEELGLPSSILAPRRRRATTG